MTVLDAKQRQEAIDPNRSFIVQAPAGSGKTELLIQRYLALLAGVARPDEILAITFTRKAAGEMKERVYKALESGKGPEPEKDHEKLTWSLARKALEKDAEMDWGILDNPSLIQIQTIDSFCAVLTGNIPILSRFGGKPEVKQDSRELYRMASERTLALLESAEDASGDIQVLLHHLDNRMNVLRDMLMTMLAKRDQWLRHLVGHEDSQRAGFEQALIAMTERRIEIASEQLSDTQMATLAQVGRYAAQNLDETSEAPMKVLADAEDFPAASIEFFDEWKGMADLILTKTGGVRKRLDKKCGFPAGKGDAAEMKALAMGLFEELATNTALEESLTELRKLPTVHYTEEQWHVLNALAGLLPTAVAQLWCVFQEEGAVDFTQVAQGAVEALGSGDDPTELLLKVDNRISHILVDEFQDTSFLQFRLLKLLTSGWNPEEGRTLFLVGDPMQSIYRFREAEVGLFLKARNEGIGEVVLESLQLTSNFRSQEGIVEWVNEIFAQSFPAREDVMSGAITYTASTAVNGPIAGMPVTVNPMINRDDSYEARKIMDTLRVLRNENPEDSVAILVRSRTHLREVVNLLKAEELAYQAQELDVLGDRQYVQDVVSVARAVLHPGDRVAWLSVLRAPWCGLTLADIHALCSDKPDHVVLDLLKNEERVGELTEDGQKRVRKVANLLEKACELRGRVPLRKLIESVWLSLGGPLCLSQSEIDDVRVVFELLDELDHGGDLISFRVLTERLAKLFAAPDPKADGKLQIMTVHKAKGLEFDHVLLPGLGKKPRGDERTLFRWMELPTGDLLLAPIPAFGGNTTDPIYDLVGRFDKEKDSFEMGRLLYVAATRARKTLHLFAHAKKNGPDKGSLLEKIWEPLEYLFEDAPVRGEESEEQDIVLEQPIARMTSDMIDRTVSDMIEEVAGNQNAEAI